MDGDRAVRSTCLQKVSPHAAHHPRSISRLPPTFPKGLTDAAGEQVTVSFTPHLIPMTRGMESDCYVRLADGVSVEDLRAALEVRGEGEEGQGERDEWLPMRAVQWLPAPTRPCLP